MFTFIFQTVKPNNKIAGGEGVGWGMGEDGWVEGMGGVGVWGGEGIDGLLYNILSLLVGDLMTSLCFLVLENTLFSHHLPIQTRGSSVFTFVEWKNTAR